MWNQMIRRLQDTSFRRKLLLSYLLLTCFIILLLGFIYNHIASNDRIENVKYSVGNVLHTNNQLVDDRMAAIEASMNNVPLDYGVLQAIAALNPYNDSSLLKTDGSITQILFKYFSNHAAVYSSYIMTPNYSFGSTASMYVPPREFYESMLATAALKGQGSEIWIPTYSYTQMYHQDSLEHINLEYSQLISIVKQLHMSSIDEEGNMHELPSRIQTPILLINIRPEALEEVFDEYVQHNDFSQLTYGMINTDGTPIFRLHKGESEPAGISKVIDQIGNQDQGMRVIEVDGQETMIFYERMQTTGWISYIEIPMSAALNSLFTLRIYMVLFLFVLVLVSIGLAYVLSFYITKPLDRIKKAMGQIEKGHFDIQVKEGSQDEFGQLIQMFNQMNSRIKQLIEENYGSRLRAKESEIMALNLQLNPHFLYNTLTTMYWIAVENKQGEIARMMISLAEMLQITTRNKKEIWTLETDLNWLEKYIYIMASRFEGKFEVHFDIQPELLHTGVPKLFLQPFIENSIIHGFGEIESGGDIMIRGWIEGEHYLFSVEDNGKGIPDHMMDKLYAGEIRSTGILNVDKRIQLLFGTEHGVTMGQRDDQGTWVLITLSSKSLSNEITPIQ